ncbi:hypothetical protein PM082_023495 [Marasmius tenuissimus]|nr:hypothetical protein PM082_023495 [Marasmius tenuissimus]
MFIVTSWTLYISSLIVDDLTVVYSDEELFLDELEDLSVGPASWHGPRDGSALNLILPFRPHHRTSSSNLHGDRSDWDAGPPTTLSVCSTDEESCSFVPVQGWQTISKSHQHTRQNKIYELIITKEPRRFHHRPSI